MSTKHTPVKYTITWTKGRTNRETIVLKSLDTAEGFYSVKLLEGKNPRMYVTELIESTRFLK